METMLSRFTVVSQGAIYLNDFIDFFEIKPITQNPRKILQSHFVLKNVFLRDRLIEIWALPLTRGRKTGLRSRKNNIKNKPANDTDQLKEEFYWDGKI
jgi:hypothetical protein